MAHNMLPTFGEYISVEFIFCYQHRSSGALYIGGLSDRCTTSMQYDPEKKEEKEEKEKKRIKQRGKEEKRSSGKEEKWKKREKREKS